MFTSYGTTLPTNADIQITLSGTFGSSISTAVNNTDGWGANEFWAAVNNITTVSGQAVPEPAGLSPLGIGVAGMADTHGGGGNWQWRRTPPSRAGLCRSDECATRSDHSVARPAPRPLFIAKNRDFPPSYGGKALPDGSRTPRPGSIGSQHKPPTM
jgi:hypothetical protein